MGDDYQVRKDIDRLIRSVYSLEGSTLRLVSFEDNSDLLPLQSIDAILDYYNLKNVEQLIEEIEAGDIDLSDYVKKEDLIDPTKYDIDLNLSFGTKGFDDTITIDMDIVDYVVSKIIDIGDE